MTKKNTQKKKKMAGVKGLIPLMMIGAWKHRKMSEVIIARSKWFVTFVTD